MPTIPSVMLNFITGLASNNLRFPGQYFLIEDGLNYNWYRHYDPTVGRYVQPDPLGFTNGPSIYLYSNGDPVSSFDQSGLASCIYSIGAHTLTCTSNSGEILSVLGPNKVWSGVGTCANNVSCEDDKYYGPIPPGNYNMNRDDRLGHNGFWRLERLRKDSSVAMLPWNKRCGFEFHPGGTIVGLHNGG